MTTPKTSIKSLIHKLESIHASEYTKELVTNYYQDWQSNNFTPIDLTKRTSISNANTIAFDTLIKQNPESNKQNLSKLAIIKLNGGLGTSMGCTGPKSLIPIKEKKCFLDIIIQNIDATNTEHKLNLPLYLMNSFYTEKETQTWLSKHPIKNVTTFTQNQFPRVNALTGNAFQHSNPIEEWNPPGHGDIYISLYQSNSLASFLEQGIEYLFISNIDNLGATIDPRILDYMIENNCPFLMETTAKTVNDKKGGVLTETTEGNVQLVEFAQVEESQHSLFFDQKRFPTFNTNNIWVHIPSLITHIENKTLQLDLIMNKKTIKNTPIIQFETAMGSAIQSFQNAKTLIVPRSRFFPVKTTSDLLFIQSDSISIVNGTIQINPNRHSPTRPVIKLSHEFKSLKEYQSRFKSIPSLVDCTHVELSGDIYSTKPVTFSGKVQIEVSKNKRYDLSEKKHYTNCNLKIN